MATKTDSKGKTTEVSDEEMREVLQSGKGIIKQVATMPDGSQKEIAIWGGYQLDGFDRTMNVFMKHEDIHTFIDIMAEEKIDPDTLKDPCEFEDGIQVSVDFLDMAAMLIFRRGQGKLSTALYSRDERRTFRDTIDAGTGEINLNEDGTFSLDKETLENNKFLIFALAVMGVRRYLMKEGIAQKLYDMFDESAGVVLKVSKAGKISAKIVKGKERPDLPCRVFLFGDQMCRPYIDEMLNLPTGMKVRNKDEKRVNKSTSDEEKNKYEIAVKAFNQAKSIYDYIDVQKQFGSIQNYKDSATYIKKCKEKISTIDALEEPYVLLVNKEQKSKDAFEKAKEEYLATKEKYDAVVSEYERENGAYSTNIQKIDEAAYSEVFRIDKQIDKIDSEWDRLKERLSEAEDELDHTFALSLGKKRQLSEETELIRSKIQELDYERNNLIMERESIIKKCEDQKVQLNGKVQNLINEANSYISIINDLVEKANKTQKEVDDAKKKVEEFVRIHGADTISVLKEYLSEKLRREEQEKQRKIEEQKRKEAEKKKREEEDRKRKEQEKKEEDEEIERFILFRMNMIDRPLLLHEISGDAEIRGYRTKKGNRITNTKEHIDNLIKQNKVMEARAGNNTYYGTT